MRDSGDIIVLNDMSFVSGTTTANWSNGVLAVSNGTVTTDISILGSFMANSFVAVNDGGKVEVHDPLSGGLAPGHP
jgi:hypothetical protein